MKDFSGCRYLFFFVRLRSIPSRYWNELDKKKLYSETPPYGHLGNTVTSLLRPFFGRPAKTTIHSIEKEPSLIWSPVNTANFFGPGIGARIYGIPLYTY